MMQKVSHYAKSCSLELWSNYHALFTLLATIAATALHSFIPLILISILSFAYLVFNQSRAITDAKPLNSPANYVTAIRCLIVVYCFMNFQWISVSWLFTLLLCNVFLDVLDGYIARKTGQTSEFGRVFDMEVDAFFVNSMGLYFLFTTNVGYLMLLPGVLRYLYRLAVWSLPQPDYQETKKFYAAALAGINFVLIVLAVIAPNPAQIYILFLSIILVSLSFTISFYEFFRHASRH